MKTIAIAAVLAIGVFGAGVFGAGVFGAGTAGASEELAKSSGCLGCHALDTTKKVGPGFKTVATANKGKADAEATISAKIISAKGHPKVKASDDEVKTLVKWVLAM